MKRRNRMLEDLDRDIHDHIERETRDNIDRGMRPDEAQFAALRKFGNAARIKEDAREVWSIVWLEQLLQDVRFGLRMLRKSPGFSVVAVLTLALGIGANTAIFSLIEAVLLRSLPVPNPQQLFLVGRATGGGENLFSLLSFQHLRDGLEGQAAVLALTQPSELYAPMPNAPPASVQGQLVSGNFFAALQVRPFRGRMLVPGDDLDPAGNPVIVISYGFWRRYFGGDPDAVSRTLTLNRVPLTVVGIAPREFFGIEKGNAAEVWLPLLLQSRLGYHSDAWSNSTRGPADTNQPWSTQSGVAWLHLAARIPDRGKLPAAASIANTVTQRDLAAYFLQLPEDQRRAKQEHERLVFTPGSKGFGGLSERFSQPLIVLMGMVELVLLIACANVAMLVLARGMARQKEVAVRLAIGARRSALVRQFLIESLLIALLGGGLGLFLAQWMAASLPGILGGGLSVDVSLNRDVLAFAFLVSLFAALLLCLGPIFRIGRIDLSTSLKSGGGRTESGSRLRSTSLFVAGQVALSLLLMIAAGLLARSLQNLFRVDPGFASQRVLTARIYPRDAGYAARQLAGLYRGLLGRIESLPGVESASLAECGFFCEEVGTTVVESSGRFPQQVIDAHSDEVSPEYLATRGIRLMRGRDFLASDDVGSPKVAIVNQTFVRRFFSGRDPIGQQVAGPIGICEVVGVAADAKISGLRDDVPPFVIYPLAQAPDYARSLEVRTIGDPLLSGTALRQAVAEAAPGLPLGEMQTIQRRLDSSLSDEELTTELSGLFAVLALALACLGVYGVTAYSVTKRTHELGIRMALGAQRATLFWMVLRESLRLVSVGIAFGIAGALVAVRLLGGMLFGLSATDPFTISAGVCIMILTAALASYIPARRAMRVDPMVALRYE